MWSYSGTFTVSVINVLGYFIIFVESKPSIITSVTSISASRRLGTAPHITAPPSSSPTELIKVKRQDFGYDTCAYINDEPFTCADLATCTSLSRQSVEYVGCCYGEEYCIIHTTCYDATPPPGMRTTDPRILSCTGTRPFCATVIWPMEPKTAYMCAEKPSTTTVDRPTETSTAPPEPTDKGGDDGAAGILQDLTPGQKIGVGVGCGVAGLAFVAGIGYCCCCSKQRRPRNTPKDDRVMVNGRSENWPEVIEARPSYVNSQA